MKGCRPWTVEEVKKLTASFEGRCAWRNSVLLIVGIATGRRVSQLLKLRVRDVVGPDGQVVDRVFFARQNVKGKVEGHSVLLNQEARAALSPWISHLMTSPGGAEAYLFPSTRSMNKPIGRKQAWFIINQACRSQGMAGKIGTHSWRKTFADRVYQACLGRVAKGEPVDAFRTTSKALSHKSINSTDHYLSFLEADVDQAIGTITF